MDKKKFDNPLIAKHQEFLRGLRKKDQLLFQSMLDDIYVHSYMLSSSNLSLIEEILLGLLLNQKRINKLQTVIQNIKKNSPKK